MSTIAKANSAASKYTSNTNNLSNKLSSANLNSCNSLNSSLSNSITISNSANTYSTLGYLDASAINFSTSSSLEYIARMLFAIPEVSETTIRSLITDIELGKDTHVSFFDDLLTSKQLSERFLNDFYDRFDLATLCRTQKVSISFIESHMADIEKNTAAFNNVCKYIPITEEFIDKHIDNISWVDVAANENINFTVKFLLKYIEKFNDDALNEISKNDSIKDGVFNVFLTELIDDIRYKLNWNAISWHKELTEENILNNLDFLDFNSYLLSTRKFKDDVITCFRKVKFGI